MTNIKNIKLTFGSYWVKCSRPTEYTDDNGDYYELWGEVAIVPDSSGKLGLINLK